VEYILSNNNNKNCSRLYEHECFVAAAAEADAATQRTSSGLDAANEAAPSIPRIFISSSPHQCFIRVPLIHHLWII